MKKMKSSGGAMSTNAKPFASKGSSKGVTPSTMMVAPVKTKGNTAKFKAGKKSVGK